MTRPSSLSSYRLASGVSTTSASVNAASGTKADLLVRPVAEGLVSRLPTPAERSPLTLVENGSVRVEDAHVAREEQRSVCGRADLERLLSPRRRGNADPARAQGTGWTTRDRGFDFVRRRRIDLHPRPAAVVEHLRQRTYAVLRMETEARFPLDHDLVGRVLLREAVSVRAHPRLSVRPTP